MSIPDLVFYGTAVATVASAAYAASSPNIVRAVFSLLGTFFGVAVIYGLLAADFAAVVQLMVYVGGILVLLLFAVMLTSHIESVEDSNRAGSWPAGLLIGALVFGGLLAVAIQAPWRQALPLPEATSTMTALGDMLAGPLVLPFMLVSLVLLGAVVGAATLARRRHSKVS